MKRELQTSTRVHSELPLDLIWSFFQTLESTVIGHITSQEICYVAAMKGFPVGALEGLFWLQCTPIKSIHPFTCGQMRTQTVAM